MGQAVQDINPGFCLRFLHTQCVYEKLQGAKYGTSFQSCPTLCNPMDWSLPGSSVHGILQARIQEWVAKPSSKGSFHPRDWTRISYVSCTGRQVPIWEAPEKDLNS